MAIRLSGMISNLDTDAIVKELMSAQSLKKTNLEQKKEKLGWKKEKWEELNTKIYALYTEKLSSLKLEGTYLAKKASSSNSEKASASATNASNGSYELKIENLASSQFVTGADISEKKLTKSSKLSEAGMSSQTITVATGDDLSKTTTIDIDSDTTISGFISQLSEAGLNASFDESNGRFYISAKESGAKGTFTIESNQSGEAGLKAIGLMDIDEEMAAGGQTAPDSSTVAVVAAKDAKYVLNGATLTSSSNTVTANGLTIELKGTTNEGEAINITVANDIDAVYDKIKEFVTSYNELVEDMYGKYTASSAKDYHMLTDEEKEAMTDDQIELWENKIKDSLLRSDTTLNSLMTTFRTAMQETVEVDGKKYDLSCFGIVTGTYLEHGILHINGNSDDAEYADKTDSLKEALANDPEGTSKALSQLFSGFYKTLTDKMSANTISSALTLYNDKQIQSQMDDYEDQISDWEDRLEDLEERYYKQFAGMETAMANLQSQQNQLSGLLGM